MYTYIHWTLLYTITFKLTCKQWCALSKALTKQLFNYIYIPRRLHVEVVSWFTIHTYAHVHDKYMCMLQAWINIHVQDER